MKEIITILVILFLIFGGAFWTNKYLKKTTNELMEIIELLETKVKVAMEAEERLDLIKEGEALKNKWEETQKGWGIIVLHQELDTIETAIATLNSNIEYGEFPDCLEEIEKLKFLIGHITEKEKFSLINIF